MRGLLGLEDGGKEKKKGEREREMMSSEQLSRAKQWVEGKEGAV